jgi:excisionase family DNA binding protein
MSASPSTAAHLRRVAVSPAEAAHMLGVSRATIYNLVARGELRHTKVAASTRIPVAEVERLAGLAPRAER